MSIFKACDIRGVYPSELNEATYAGLGSAIGTILRERSLAPQVLVAGDVRPSTPPLRAALMDGLVAAGCRVADLGIAPTPVAYFAARRLHPDGLAIVTASHNPPCYNGLKLTLGPVPITEEEMARVEHTAASRRFAAARGSVHPVSVEEEYVAFLSSTARPGHGRRFVLDCGNGGYSELAPRVLRRLGYDVAELFCTPDGTFPNRSPNPADPEALRALSRSVRESRAAFGVALDGDGDRIAIVDDAGRPLTGDESIILLARQILRSSPLPLGEGRVRDAGARSGAGLRGDFDRPSPHPSPEGRGSLVSPLPEGEAREKVVCDIKCSRAVLDAIGASGGTALLERSGHTFIKTRMITENARFGGELSGHFFYRELAGSDDGLYSILRVAELAGEADAPLSAIVDAMPRYHTTPDLRVPYEAGDGPARLDQIAAAATGDVLRLDGVRVAYPDGWGLARCSVTEPLLTFRFEAYKGSPRRIAERFLAAAPDLLRVVLARLDSRQEK